MSLDDLDPSVAETLRSLHIDDDGVPESSAADIQQNIDARNALREWQSESLIALQALRARLLSDGSPISPSETAEVISDVARFDGLDDFILPELRDISRDIVSRICPLPPASRCEVLSLVLSKHIKPLFLPTQHPSVNQDTGRKNPTREGGRLFHPEFHEDQVWKVQGKGCWNALLWVASQIQREDYEKLWPLMIPPLMTLLDDYQAEFRIRGIQVLSEFLNRVDPNLLKQTGIASLFSTSLLNSLNRSTDSEISTILPLASLTLQKLIEMTTEVGSQERFDRLCECLSTGVIGGVWVFAGDKLDAMEASIETLGPLIDALGIGCCRYLKALIPQLAEVMVPKELRPHSVRLITLSTDCLIRVIVACKPRIGAWKNVILDACLHCWVWVEEDAKADEPVDEVRNNLRRLCEALAEACPSLVKEEFPTLLEWNPSLLRDLLPPLE